MRPRVQGALDTCARLVDEHSVSEVAAAVASLLRSGAAPAIWCYTVAL